MAAVIEQAVTMARGVKGDSVFDVWRQVWDGRSYAAFRSNLPPLLVHFGTSLVERALIEAFCKQRGRPFWQQLRDNDFGVQLGVIHTQLNGRQPADFLPETPLSEIIARHTVGLADPLEDSDIAAVERLHDGLPQSLSACIERYRLRHFKIKVAGNIDKDVARLERIAAILRRQAPADFRFSLDGNEQFHVANDFIVWWNEVANNAELRNFFEHLLFVEQPFHRDQALDPAAVKQLRDWPERPLLIIDESDAELFSLPRALRLGYSGTSHKNCKGVFKGVANACLLAHLQREHPDERFIMSGEDLANIGPVALLQDLAVCAALGIASVERNGHHYFAGLSMFPAKVQARILEMHDDLYEASPAGWPTLRITDGTIQVASLNRAPLGVGFEMEVDGFMSLEQFVPQVGQ
jgi:L-alanine-DL-glutamate epimerase-like enolase superfamily enzyme